MQPPLPHTNTNKRARITDEGNKYDAHSISNSEPLPKGWSFRFSQTSNRSYYHHTATNHAQWDRPTAFEIANPDMAKKRKQVAAETKSEVMKLSQIKSKAKHVEREHVQKMRQEEAKYRQLRARIDAEERDHLNRLIEVDANYKDLKARTVQLVQFLKSQPGGENSCLGLDLNFDCPLEVANNLRKPIHSKRNDRTATSISKEDEGKGGLSSDSLASYQSNFSE